MTDLPPLLRDQRKIDREQVNLLAIFHFVVAGLAVCAAGFLALHYLVMSSFLLDPKFWAGQKNGTPPPPEIFRILKWFYVAFGGFIATGFVGNLISGFCLRARRGRVFSFVVAAMNCLHFPFGTVLGVFTIIVLARESVRELYAPPGLRQRQPEPGR